MSDIIEPIEGESKSIDVDAFSPPISPVAAPNNNNDAASELSDEEGFVNVDENNHSHAHPPATVPPVPLRPSSASRASSPIPAAAAAATPVVAPTEIKAPVSPTSEARSGLGLDVASIAASASSSSISIGASAGSDNKSGAISPTPRETGGTPSHAECSLCEASVAAYEMCKQCSLFCCQVSTSSLRTNTTTCADSRF
jgi:hypothetical protein